jgi:acetoin utilization deacetylase AcuC-like enzyme
VPLPAGSGHETYLYAFEKIVIPALKAYRPDLIIVASGLDANAVDPLARMLLHSESFRALTGMILETADELCGGKLVVVHEGGYAESYVPFCGHAVLEALSGESTGIPDPALDMFRAQQPDARTLAFQRLLVDDMAAQLAT